MGIWRTGAGPEIARTPAGGGGESHDAELSAMGQRGGGVEVADTSPIKRAESAACASRAATCAKGIAGEC